VLEEENAKLKKVLADRMVEAAALREFANARRSFGYRRLFVLLRRESERSGKNRISRLNREEGLTVRKRRVRRRATPAQYAANLTATGDRLRNPDQLRRSPVATSAHSGVSNTETLNCRRMKVHGQVTLRSSPPRFSRSRPSKTSAESRRTLGIAPRFLRT